MADVFISYKSERQAAAVHLKEILRLHGYSVWFDYSLLKGHDFRRQIERELRDAKAVVVLWCSRSVASDWVHEEAAFAKNLGVLLPVLIEKVALPFGYALADTIDLQHWDGAPRSHRLDPLIDAVVQRVGREAVIARTGLVEYDRTWRNLGALPLSKMPLSTPLELEPQLGAAPPPIINDQKVSIQVGDQSPRDAMELAAEAARRRATEPVAIGVEFPPRGVPGGEVRFRHLPAPDAPFAVLTEHIAEAFKEREGVDLRYDAMAMQRVRDAAEMAWNMLKVGEEAKVSLPFIGQREGVWLDFELTVTRDDLLGSFARVGKGLAAVSAGVAAADQLRKGTSGEAATRVLPPVVPARAESFKLLPAGELDATWLNSIIDKSGAANIPPVQRSRNYVTFGEVAARLSRVFDEVLLEQAWLAFQRGEPKAMTTRIYLSNGHAVFKKLRSAKVTSDNETPKVFWHAFEKEQMGPIYGRPDETEAFVRLMCSDLGKVYTITSHAADRIR